MSSYLRRYLLLRLTILISLTSNATVGLGENHLPADFSVPMNEIMKLSGQKNYPAALELALQLWNSSVHRPSSDRVVAGNIALAQYVNLGKWNEGETLVLSMLQIPDVEFQAGIYSFSQKA